MLLGGVVIVRHMLAQARGYPGGVFGFAIFWASDILTLYAALRAFEVHPPLSALVYRFFTLWLPILPAALAATQVRALDPELPGVPRASFP